MTIQIIERVTAMPTQNVNLPQHQSEFIQDRIQGGRFKNASEVVRAGLRLLEQQESENELKLEALRKAAQEGFDAIERGEFETITPDNLDQFMESVSGKRKQA